MARLKQPRPLEDVLSVQPDVNPSNAVPLPGGLAGHASVTWLSAFSPAAAGVREDVIVDHGGRQRFATVADVVVSPRLAEVARASAPTRCGRAGRCLCHPRSVLVHGWEVELTRNPVLEAFPVDAADVAELVVGVVVALALG